MSSTIPDAIDGLKALCDSAAPSGWTVVDGPPVRAIQKLVAVAFTGADGEAAVEDTDELSGPSLGRDLERYRITSQVSAWAGNGEVSARRREVFDTLDAIKAALNADKTLGGAVELARFAGKAYAPSRDDPGPTVAVNFTVEVQAFER